MRSDPEIDEVIEMLQHTEMERELDECAALGISKDRLTDDGYNLAQIRQIHKGLLDNVDISEYMNM